MFGSKQLNKTRRFEFAPEDRDYIMVPQELQMFSCPARSLTASQPISISLFPRCSVGARKTTNVVNCQKQLIRTSNRQPATNIALWSPSPQTILGCLSKLCEPLG